MPTSLVRRSARHARRSPARALALLPCVLLFVLPSIAHAVDRFHLEHDLLTGARGTVLAPDDTIAVTGTIPYLGGVASGSGYVYLGAGHTAVENPIVVVEGFDFNNDLDADELYELLDQEGLIETMRAMSFDVVVLNFTDATDYIQRNAFLLVELLATVESLVDPSLEYPLVGASMGGLVSRYALAYMETTGITHRVHTFMSFDAPHDGANIPLGIQYWLAFFEGESQDAADFLAALDSPAARQMLVYHHTDPPSPTGTHDPLRDAWEADLAAVGDYPSTTRNVAISNGSGAGAGQGFSPGEQILEWEHDGAIVDVVGNAFAVADGPSQIVFEGALLFFGLGEEQDVLVGGTGPIDGAPGGLRSSMAEMDAVSAPFGDIVALYPSHAFIPTISAIDIDTTDLFYDVLADPDAVALTPFEAIHVPAVNEPHIFVSPATAAWILDQIAPQVAVGDPDAAPGPSPLRAGPSPFTTGTRVAFELTAPGRVSLSVYDVSGRRIAELANGVRARGSHRVTWDGRDASGLQVAGGVYIARLDANGRVTTAKLVRR